MLHNAIASATYSSENLHLNFSKSYVDPLVSGIRFFIRNTENLIPVEVKARKGTSQSLRSLINSEKYSDIRWGIKLSMNNIGFENNIMTIPYFCTFLMKKWIKDKPTGNG